MTELGQLEQALGHRFRDRALLVTALTHGSALPELSCGEDEGVMAKYERLEFLGDSVLGLVTASWLFSRLPDATEGELARWKSYLVSARALFRLAHRLELSRYLRLGAGEEQSGGRKKRSLLADVAESVLGAMFLDGGLEPVQALLEPWLEELRHSEPEIEEQDAKTKLQELLQAGGGQAPAYRITAESGPDHARVFEAVCLAADQPMGSGVGPSKKRAERRAAREALRRLENGELELPKRTEG